MENSKLNFFVVQDDPMCVAARTDGKVLVTGLWVDHSFDIGMPVDPTSVSFFIQLLNSVSREDSVMYMFEI